MYRIEHARVRPQTRTLRTLLDLYGVEKEQQAELVALLRDARERGWLHAYQSELPEQYMTFIGFEGEAESAWNYESLFVPGLLQTEDYARAVIRAVLPFASRDEVERRVEVRMERQEVLRERQSARTVGHRRRGSPPPPGWRPGRHASTAPSPRGGIRASQHHVPGHPVRCRCTRGHAGLVRRSCSSPTKPSRTSSTSTAWPGDLFLEAESDVRRYKLVFEHLRAVAASPDDSKSLVASLAAEK